MPDAQSTALGWRVSSMYRNKKRTCVQMGTWKGKGPEERGLRESPAGRGPLRTPKKALKGQEKGQEAQAYPWESATPPNTHFSP